MRSTSRAWVQGAADAPGVVANLRIASTDRPAQDTGEAAQPDTTIVLPFVGESSGASTEISVANTSSSFGRVILNLYDKTGNVIASRDSSLLPFAVNRGSVS